VATGEAERMAERRAASMAGRGRRSMRKLERNPTEATCKRGGKRGKRGKIGKKGIEAREVPGCGRGSGTEGHALPLPDLW
jgi:hypothetical protein